MTTSENPKFEDLNIGDPIVRVQQDSKPEYYGRILSLDEHELDFEKRKITHQSLRANGGTFRVGMLPSPELFSDVAVGDTIRVYEPIIKTLRPPTTVSKVKIGEEMGYSKGAAKLGLYLIKEGWYYLLGDSSSSPKKRANDDNPEKPDHWPFMPKIGELLTHKVDEKVWNKRHQGWMTKTIHKINLDYERISFTDGSNWSFDKREWKIGYQFRASNIEDLHEDAASQQSTRIPKSSLKRHELEKANNEIYNRPIAPETCGECGTHQSSPIETNNSILDNEGINIKQFRMGMIQNNERIKPRKEDRV
jgi:hypothetical protein